MESSFFSALFDTILNGKITEIHLLIIIIGMLIISWLYVFKPIYFKIKAIPTSNNIKNIIKEVTIEDDKTLLTVGNNISNKLDKIIESLEEIEELDKGSYKDIKDLKKDIEQIKQILNQFQGHLMYSRNDFGNRELR